VSIVALKWAREPRPGLGGPATAVLRDLADRSNDSGVCWPSLTTIMADTGFSERTVRRALRRLEAEKLLQTKRIYGRSSRYMLQLPRSERPDTPVTVTGTPASVTPKALRSEREARGAHALEDHRANADAYRKQQDVLPDVTVDQDALLLARQWLERKP